MHVVDIERLRTFAHVYGDGYHSNLAKALGRDVAWVRTPLTPEATEHECAGLPVCDHHPFSEVIGPVAEVHTVKDQVTGHSKASVESNKERNNTTC